MKFVEVDKLMEMVDLTAYTLEHHCDDPKGAKLLRDSVSAIIQEMESEREITLITERKKKT